MVLSVWCSSQAAATDSCARSHAPEYQHLVGTARMQIDGHISPHAVERDVDENRSPEVGFGTWHSRTTIRTYRALGNPVTGASLVCDFGPYRVPGNPGAIVVPVPPPTAGEAALLLTSVLVEARAVTNGRGPGRACSRLLRAVEVALAVVVQ